MPLKANFQVETLARNVSRKAARDGACDLNGTEAYHAYGNPLIAEVFEDYKRFKRMKFIREELSLSEHGIVNLETLGLIREHNKRCLNEKELYPTNLCKANKIIRDLVLDNYESDGAVTVCPCQTHFSSHISQRTSSSGGLSPSAVQFLPCNIEWEITVWKQS